LGLLKKNGFQIENLNNGKVVIPALGQSYYNGSLSRRLIVAEGAHKVANNTKY